MHPGSTTHAPKRYRHNGTPPSTTTHQPPPQATRHAFTTSTSTAFSNARQQHVIVNARSTRHRRMTTP
eukprot:scaffold5390_cov116-Isochrysis_galbana.AAC.14